MSDFQETQEVARPPHFSATRKKGGAMSRLANTPDPVGRAFHGERKEPNAPQEEVVAAEAPETVEETPPAAEKPKKAPAKKKSAPRLAKKPGPKSEPEVETTDGEETPEHQIRFLKVVEDGDGKMIRRVDRPPKQRRSRSCEGHMPFKVKDKNHHAEIRGAIMSLGYTMQDFLLLALQNELYAQGIDIEVKGPVSKRSTRNYN
ncbi:hypothetical protein [Tranquillimonas alkanivorans]|uniref:Uncharacterized protein n=1 Tax=Tranquillimonas alkanivorans TaxID=441119 RepID=A0A1I5W3A4_9RHOB|nr:hypothetical protein [Tranquillimonas alkanivorans]SFQ14163.1 hypothetical protein SAMN04488047_13923 [Tranquillimonas alkanivorans]